MQILIHIRGGVSLVMSSVLALGKHFRLGIILAFACLACILSSVPAVSQGQLPNHIKIGVRTVASAIGNNISTNKAYGFCGTFGEELQEELKKLAPNGKRIEVEYHEIKNEGLGYKYPRYDGLNKKIIHIECGPNSIPSDNLKTAVGIKFSDSFHKTGVKLLLPEKLVEDLNSKRRNVKDIKVGVVKETTTSNLLEGIVDNIRPYDTRDEALNALLDKNVKEIEAFASDALILQTILDSGYNSKEPFNRKGYTIFKKDGYLTSLPTEDYVMAVKENTPFSNKLIESINRTLKRDKISQAMKKLEHIEYSTPTTPPTSGILLRLQEFLSSIFTEILGVFITLLSTFIILLKRTRLEQREHLRLFLWILGAVLCVLGVIIIIAIWLQYKKL
jgi:Bacterial extracellular solute-binding proteins, family 3.